MKKFAILAAALLPLYAGATDLVANDGHHTEGRETQNISISVQVQQGSRIYTFSSATTPVSEGANTDINGNLELASVLLTEDSTTHSATPGQHVCFSKSDWHVSKPETAGGELVVYFGDSLVDTNDLCAVTTDLATKYMRFVLTPGARTPGTYTINGLITSYTN